MLERIAGCHVNAPGFGVAREAAAEGERSQPVGGTFSIHQADHLRLISIIHYRATARSTGAARITGAAHGWLGRAPGIRHRKCGRCRIGWRGGECGGGSRAGCEGGSKCRRPGWCGSVRTQKTQERREVERNDAGREKKKGDTEQQGYFDTHKSFNPLNLVFQPLGLSLSVSKVHSKVSAITTG
jgi:hypothetical protein